MYLCSPSWTLCGESEELRDQVRCAHSLGAPLISLSLQLRGQNTYREQVGTRANRPPSLGYGITKDPQIGSDEDLQSGARDRQSIALNALIGTRKKTAVQGRPL
jgi:hypothetical protein